MQNSSRAKKSRAPVAAKKPQRKDELVSLAIGKDRNRKLRRMIGIYNCVDGLPGTSASGILRDMIDKTYDDLLPRIEAVRGKESSQS